MPELPKSISSRHVVIFVQLTTAYPCSLCTYGREVPGFATPLSHMIPIQHFASPLLTAAALQIEADIPNFVIHEQHAYNRYAYNRKLCLYDYQPHNGAYGLPELPGIGNEFSSWVFTSDQVQRMVIN